MSIAIEVSSGKQTFDVAAYEIHEPLELNHENIHGYLGSLAAVQPLDKRGNPIQVSAQGISGLVRPEKDDAAGWSLYLAALKDEGHLVDSPFTVGRVMPHTSDMYFFVTPDRAVDTTTRPPSRLFAYGKVLVLPLVQRSY